MKSAASIGGPIVFEKEQYNRYDENAFKAYAVGKNGYLEHVAYLKREHAAILARNILNGKLDIEWPGKKVANRKYIVCEFEYECDLQTIDSDKTVLVGEVKAFALMSEDELDEFIADDC